MPFMVMVGIIIIAFANYFYVANNNLLQSQDPNIFTDGGIDDSTETYFPSFFGVMISDVLVSVYMLGALGSFDSTLYREGPDKYRAMLMFLLATFIIQVVFMNMLIAIMGETFGQVLEASVESGIREQVALIADHDWLLDLTKIFKGKKYIIRVQASSSDEGSEEAIYQTVTDVKEKVLKKINKV
jgi:hypothetical protein